MRKHRENRPRACLSLCFSALFGALIFAIAPIGFNVLTFRGGGPMIRAERGKPLPNQRKGVVSHDGLDS